MNRQRLLPVAVLAVVALLGVGLALFAFSGAGTKGASTVVRPDQTYIAPQSSTESLPGQSRAGATNVGSFSIVVPKGAAGVNHVSQGSQDRLTFTVGHVQAAAASDAARPGESLDEVATLYGTLKGHKIITIAGTPGYRFTSLNGGDFSIVILGLSHGRLLTLQLVGPKGQFAKAQALARKLSASMHA